MKAGLSELEQWCSGATEEVSNHKVMFSLFS